MGNRRQHSEQTRPSRRTFVKGLAMGGVVAGLGLWRNSAWADYYNFHQRTVGTFFRDVKEHGLRNTPEDRALWGRMRMTPTDIADVTGYTYTQGWIGHDVNRFWFRTEGEAEGRGVADAYADALFGRAIRPFWDVVAGVRQDFEPGPGRTWAAVGIQGLAPYWFEVEATAYVGESWRTLFRVETQYELLLTNRLILQPRVELDVYGKGDPQRGIGAGLSSGEAGLRLRYEFRREVAPYIGVTWNRKFFGTAGFARAAGENARRARFAMGVRVWF